jgi:hypothetical protein
VHSSAISMPRTFQGNAEGSLYSVTINLPLPRLI